MCVNYIHGDNVHTRNITYTCMLRLGMMLEIWGSRSQARKGLLVAHYLALRSTYKIKRRGFTRFERKVGGRPPFTLSSRPWRWRSNEVIGNVVTVLGWKLTIPTAAVAAAWNNSECLSNPRFYKLCVSALFFLSWHALVENSLKSICGRKAQRKHSWQPKLWVKFGRRQVDWH